MLVCYPFKLKYLNQKEFLSHIEKTLIFSWEHKVHILKGFKSHIEKNKFLIVNIEYIY
jgi:hypothetical protein